jgi:hypothetical protein
MRWAKQGLVVTPSEQAPWIGTHAALPVVVSNVDGRHRIYFSSRDRHNRSHVGYVTVSLNQAADPPAFSRSPVLSPGALGTFDDAGVNSASWVEERGRCYLFYTGWSLGVSVPFYLHAGAAVSDDGGNSFRRLSEAPLLDRTSVDPYLTASPWVLVENGLWRMWYVSGTGWDVRPRGPRHRYHIKYAESRDGLRWDRRGVVCIDYGAPGEYAFGRPCVVKDQDCYRMWYSHRGANYRIGYAESADGIVWTRLDELIGLEPSASPGWDAEMMTYPVVADVAGRRYMLYNGNGYGRTGIGLAAQVQ